MKIKNIYKDKEVSEPDEMLAIIARGKLLDSLVCANDDLRKNQTVIKAALKANIEDFEFVNEDIRWHDKELMLFAVEGSARNIDYISPKLKRTKTFVLECIKRNCFVVLTMDDRFKRNKEMLDCAFKENQLENFRKNRWIMFHFS